MGETGKTRFLEHPYSHALFSNFILALVLLSIGSYWQQENWAKQDEISRNRTKLEKYIDRREQIIREMLVLSSEMEMRIWNLYFAKGEEKTDSKYRVQETGAKMLGVTYELLIYFQDAPKIKDNLLGILKFWKSIYERIQQEKIDEAGIKEEWKQIEPKVSALADEAIRAASVTRVMEKK